jgi:hypothetical protein
MIILLVDVVLALGQILLWYHAVAQNIPFSVQSPWIKVKNGRQAERMHATWDFVALGVHPQTLHIGTERIWICHAYELCTTAVADTSSNLRLDSCG